MAEPQGWTIRKGRLCSRIVYDAQKLSGVEHSLMQALMQQTVMHHDETGVPVENRRTWMSAIRIPPLTHPQMYANRGQMALEAFGIGPLCRSISVHDGWGPSVVSARDRAVCHRQVLQEGTCLTDGQGFWWAVTPKALRLDRNAATEQAREQEKSGLHSLDVVACRARFLDLLDDGDRAYPYAQTRLGRRGGIIYSVARQILARVCTHQQTVLASLKDLRVPVDTTLTERDLRMVAVQ
jgi:transposase